VVVVVEVEVAVEVIAHALREIVLAVDLVEEAEVEHKLRLLQPLKPNELNQDRN
jgi:hypothetical protein